MSYQRYDDPYNRSQPPPIAQPYQQQQSQPQYPMATQGDIGYGNGHGNGNGNGNGNGGRYNLAHQDSYNGHVDDYYGQGQEENLTAPLTAHAAPPGAGDRGFTPSPGPYQGMSSISRQGTNMSDNTYDSNKYGPSDYTHINASKPSFFPGDVVYPPPTPFSGGGGYPPPSSPYSSGPGNITPGLGGYNSYPGFGVGQDQGYAQGPPVNFNGGMEYPQGWNGGGQQWVQARDKLMRHRSIKQVKLDANDNLIIDIPVPSQILPPGYVGGSGKADPVEMSHLRYSAVTCDPDQFKRNGFKLRPAILGRKTEMFIVMTMYNEDDVLFLKTMNAVIKNITNLVGRDRSKTWGKDAWTKVVVCVVQDGRKSVNPRTLKVLQLMGAYAEGVMKDSVAGKDVEAHVFEYTSQVTVTEKGEVGHGSVPIQILFCLKENNAKKLNSHRWFFNAFAEVLQPNVCILLDVGTRPTGNSLHALYKAFERNPNCGGACGEICADLGPYGRNLVNPIVAGQCFEYKSSNILDKPFESVTGFISVLPGAFSAYRYQALLNHQTGDGPLASYFKGEAMHRPGAAASISNRNMFLAEDRILAFEIVTKKKAKWTLHYVRGAQAYTDVPTTVDSFISQRRRWLNGSFFASLHSIVHFGRILTSGQNPLRKVLLVFLTLYNFIAIIFSWFSVSSFYLAFYFLGSSATSGDWDAFGGYGEDIFSVFNKVYIALIFIVLVCSLGNRPAGSKWMYTGCIFLFACCQGMLLYCAGYNIYETVPKTSAEWEDISGLWSNSTFRDLALSFGATYGIYILSSILYLSPWHMITCFVQYLFLLPSYTNVLLIYSLCNLQDVTWGNRPEAAPKDLGGAKAVKGKDGTYEIAIPTAKKDLEMLYEQAKAELRLPAKEEVQHRTAEVKRSDSDRNFRTNVVLLFLGCNMALVLLFTSTIFTSWISKTFSLATTSTFNPYLTFIFWSVLILSTIRFIGSLLYLVFNLFGR